MKPKSKKINYKRELEELLAEKFTDYSRYIIQDRALPDVRDGLKPVQRRILFAMHQLKLYANKPFKKSVRIIGEVIGKYHPHGDSSVYDALIRLSQTWKMNYPLIEVQGNNGSIDNDPPAAMRYTEARLTPISSTLFTNISEQLVPYINNFDDSETEPLILPSLLPNLLINGASGIAAGYSTNIPPHNFGEITKALIYRLHHPTATLAEVTDYCPGPDFPTGGFISDPVAIEEIYRTGKGKITITSKMKLGHQKIIVTEIPYEVNKQNIIRKIEQLIVDHPEYQIKAVVDQSDRNGLQLVIHLEPTADRTQVWHNLLRLTDLATPYYVNMVALHEDRPQQLGLLSLLDAYLSYQMKLQKQQLYLEKQKITARLEIINGLIKIALDLDQLVKIIRQADNKQDAITKLALHFLLNERQAAAIVNLRLYRLTSSDVNDILSEQTELNQKLLTINNLLADDAAFKHHFEQRLNACEQKFSQKRRSIIQAAVEPISASQQTKLIIPQTLYFLMTQRGYCLVSKQMLNYNQILAKDYLVCDQKTLSNHFIACVTAQGYFFCFPITAISSKDELVHISNYIKWNDNDTIVLAYRFVANKNYETELCFISTNNFSKRIKLNLLHAATPLNPFRIHPTSCLNAFVVTEDELIFCATASGHGVIYPVNSIAISKFNARGVKLLNLGDSDQIIHASLWNKEQQQYYFDQNEWHSCEINASYLYQRPARGKRINPKKKVVVQHLLNLKANSVIQYQIAEKGLLIGNFSADFFDAEQKKDKMIEPLNNVFLT